MAAITIKTKGGTEYVDEDAELIGSNLAVHRDINSRWSVIHVASGLAILPISYSYPARNDALALARMTDELFTDMPTPIGLDQPEYKAWNDRISPKLKSALIAVQFGFY